MQLPTYQYLFLTQSNYEMINVLIPSSQQKQRSLADWKFFDLFVGFKIYAKGNKSVLPKSTKEDDERLK